jgi:hypothetical protein
MKVKIKQNQKNVWKFQVFNHYKEIGSVKPCKFNNNVGLPSDFAKSMINGIYHGEFYLYNDFIGGLVIFSSRGFINCKNIFLEMILSPLVLLIKYIANMDNNKISLKNSNQRN